MVGVENNDVCAESQVSSSTRAWTLGLWELVTKFGVDASDECRLGSH